MDGESVGKQEVVGPRSDHPSERSVEEIGDECLSPMTKSSSAVHRHRDGSWWWYTEGWDDEIGPYPNRGSAEEAVERHIEELGRGA